MRLDAASREFGNVVTKSRNLEEILRTTLKAATTFKEEMGKARSILQTAATDPANQQGIVDEFNAMMRGIRDSSRQAAGLITEIAEILIRIEK